MKHPPETDQIVMYTTSWCPDCKRVKKMLSELRVPYINIDIEGDEEAIAIVEKINKGKRVIPTILFPDGDILIEPSNAEVARKLGLTTRAKQKFYDVVIVGGGPTGLTAAIYLAREGFDTLIIEKAGMGGQVSITQKLDNFPGFPEGITGAEFADRLTQQAKRFGVEILQANEVSQITKLENQNFCVTISDEHVYDASVVLLATGASYRRLGIPGEEDLIGINVHFCATCDGAFYKDKKVLVIGGGNSGFEEGLFLTRFARQVDIVEFSPEVKASKLLQDKVSKHPKMTVTVNHAVKSFVGKDKLAYVVIENRTNGETKKLEYDGVFVFIGLTPNHSLADELTDLDEYGFIKTVHMMTRTPGLFAAGDVRSGSTKQAAAAAGEGATAAVLIREYFQNR